MWEDRSGFKIREYHVCGRKVIFNMEKVLVGERVIKILEKFYLEERGFKDLVIGIVGGR